jgi:hypothetical protein
MIPFMFILVVQLIYAFQGASSNNLKNFLEFFAKKNIEVQRVALRC